MKKLWFTLIAVAFLVLPAAGVAFGAALISAGRIVFGIVFFGAIMFGFYLNIRQIIEEEDLTFFDSDYITYSIKHTNSLTKKLLSIVVLVIGFFVAVWISPLCCRPFSGSHHFHIAKQNQ